MSATASTNTTYLNLLQSIDCYARSELTGSEYSALHFIIQRTYRYGHKLSEYISMKHLTQGVYDGGGNLMVAAASRDERTVRKALAGLTKKGYIAVMNTQSASRANTCNKFTLLIENIIEINCKIMNNSKLKIGKKSAQNKESDPPAKMAVGAPCKNAPLSKGTREVRELDRAQRSARTVMESIKETTEQHIQRQEAKQKTLDSKMTMRAVHAAWSLQLRKHVPVAPPPSPLSKEDFYKFRSGFTASRLSMRTAAFIEWSIVEWSSLRLNELKWVKDMGVVPSLSKLCQLTRFFAMAYIERKAAVDQQQDRVVSAASSRQRDDSEKVAHGHAEDLQKRLRALQREKAHYQRLALRKEAQPAKRRRSTTTTTKNEELAGPIGEWKDEQGS